MIETGTDQDGDTNNEIAPIAAKLRDTAALEKVVRQAVTEAVEKARKLGFLQSTTVQEETIEYKPK